MAMGVCETRDWAYKLSNCTCDLFLVFLFLFLGGDGCLTAQDIEEYAVMESIVD